MKYSLPPFNEKPKKGFIEQQILNFSKEMFNYPIIGISFLLALNLLYIYSCLKSISIFSLLLYIFLYYLLISIILTKVLGLQRNK